MGNFANKWVIITCPQTQGKAIYKLAQSWRQKKGSKLSQIVIFCNIIICIFIHCYFSQKCHHFPTNSGLKPHAVPPDWEAFPHFLAPCPIVPYRSSSRATSSMKSSQPMVILFHNFSLSILISVLKTAGAPKALENVGLSY